MDSVFPGLGIWPMICSSTLLALSLFMLCTGNEQNTKKSLQIVKLLVVKSYYHQEHASHLIRLCFFLEIERLVIHSSYWEYCLSFWQWE